MKDKLKIIGLTGGTGSGKGAVSISLSRHGAFVIDCDKVAHCILEKGKPAYEEIVSHFGNQILDEEGEIIRKKLGDIVFSNQQKLSFLNECTHKYIVLEIHEQIRIVQQCREDYFFVVIDAPLLIEAGLVPLCDFIIVVFAEESLRIARIMERDSLTYKQAQSRIDNQKSWEEYKSCADFVIDNSRDIAFLEEQINKVIVLMK